MVHTSNTSGSGNPNFNMEFGQYLKSNGYIPGLQSEFSDTIYYFKKDHGVMITGDSVDFGIFPESVDGQRKPGCSRYAAFTGISKLDISGWMLLMHITGTVPLKQIQGS